jgi:hypothetical protein
VKFTDEMFEMKTKRNVIIVGDRVLIGPDERSEKTASGLHRIAPHSAILALVRTQLADDGGTA